MAVLRVNPTRMELSKLKKSHATARKGHKLLKDKRDEMVKQFLELVRKNRILRAEVEDGLVRVSKGFAAASTVMSRQTIEESFACPKQTAALTVSSRNVMSVDVPVFSYELTGTQSDGYPYGFVFTSGELDDSVSGLCDLLPKLIELAETEKTVMMLAAEIEKTRRRVNALEHVLIPNQQETIKYIVAKLDENERGNLSRLMKVKEMMSKRT